MAVAERVLEIGHRVPDATLVTDALLLSGNIAWERGDCERARACYEEAARWRVEAGYATSRGLQLNNLGMLVRQMGDPSRALSLLTDAAEVLAAVDDHDGQGWAVVGQAFALTDLGRLAEARAAIHEGLALGSSTASPEDRLYALEAIAMWLGAAGQPRAALMPGRRMSEGAARSASPTALRTVRGSSHSWPATGGPPGSRWARSPGPRAPGWT